MSRVQEVARLGADLPDAVVRFSPRSGSGVGQHGQEGPQWQVAVGQLIGEAGGGGQQLPVAA
jgi:hypothetical protein